MKIGMMNNPRSDVTAEIDTIASYGFDFIDLTLEYPKAHVAVLDKQVVLDAIKRSGLSVVGHTTYYLPFASPVNAIREAAINDAIACLGFFKEAGAELVTVHPDPGVGAVETKSTISLNALSFKIISDEAAKHDLTIVVENVPGVFSSVEALGSILNSVPALRFHLDVGHAFVRRNRFRQLLGAFKDKLSHIHLSDNRLRDDDHMPLGTGSINWEDVVPSIRRTGYDSTFTLEVFSGDPRYVMLSSDKLKELWDSSRTS
jgi:sugar phosphate isomerase/epimerase